MTGRFTWGVSTNQGPDSASQKVADGLWEVTSWKSWKSSMNGAGAWPCKRSSNRRMCKNKTKRSSKMHQEMSSEELQSVRETQTSAKTAMLWLDQTNKPQLRTSLTLTFYASSTQNHPSRTFLKEIRRQWMRYNNSKDLLFGLYEGNGRRLSSRYSQLLTFSEIPLKTNSKSIQIASVILSTNSTSITEASGASYNLKVQTRR